VHAGVFLEGREHALPCQRRHSEVIALDPRTGNLSGRCPCRAPHELAVTHDGKTAYVSRRTLGKVSVIDLETQTILGDIALSVPDTLQLSANEKLLTVGLRSPGPPLWHRWLVVNTSTMEVDVVTIGGVGTIAGHQWTSPNGQYTYGAFEGPGPESR
jgi:DNA-binding beta-propeller fold protein YncE